MKLRSFLLVVVVQCSALSIFAQDAHPILSEFVAIRQYKGILLKWTIRGGNQCEGTKVFRSFGEEPFQLIEHISGICGGADFDETYTHHDTLPFKNAENHYRLEMGDLGFTETITLFYEDFGQSDHARLTDDATGTVTFLVDNAERTSLTLHILDRSGLKVSVQETTGNAFRIRTDELESGIYFYRISGGGIGNITGRFAVAR